MHVRLPSIVARTRRTQATMHGTLSPDRARRGRSRVTAFAGRHGMLTLRVAALAGVVLTGASPAWAHHRQTPPVVEFTGSGDTMLPRVAAQGWRTFTLILQSGAGQQVVTISPFRKPTLQTPQGSAGDVANASISASGRRVVWDAGDDPLGLGLPGRQLVMSDRGVLAPLTDDVTGTSENPAVDSEGLRVAFESSGDLAGTGNSGARQIFVRDPDGTIRQASTGTGTSRNAVVSAKKNRLAFESTSDPVTGLDSGVSQIWLGDLSGTPAVQITNGAGASQNPALSDDGGMLAFESTADLAGTGADTGVSQIFIFDPKSQTFARITDDAGGCTLPNASKVQRDWRIAFVCGGQAYYYMLRKDQRFQVQTGGGVTQRVMGEMGIHFLILSTTADLLDGGVTSGRQVYMVNLFKRPADLVPGLATWFPTRGIPAL
jgi:Tol biopolymer transport system component